MTTLPNDNEQPVEVDATSIIQLLKQKALVENDRLLQTQIECCFWQAAHMGLTADVEKEQT